MRSGAGEPATQKANSGSGEHVTTHPGTQEADERVSLQTSVQTVLGHKWLILQVLLLAVGASLTISYVQTPVYTATTQIVTSPPDVSGVFTNPSARAYGQDAARRVATLVQLFKSVEVAKLATAKMGYRGRPQSLSEKVTVGAVGQTDVLEVSVTDPDAEQAALIANTMATAFIEFQAQRSLQTIRGLTEEIAKKRDEAKAQVEEYDREFAAALATKNPNSSRLEAIQAKRDAALVEYNDLRRKYDELQLQAGLQQETATVVEQASVPTSPSAPRPLRNAALAGFLGLVLGIGLAFLRDALDDSVTTQADVESALGAPMLGAVPDFGRLPRHERDKNVPRLAKAGSAPTEAFRRLRTNIRFLGLDQPVRLIGVTSAKADEGKSTVTANLATSMAQSGLRIAVVAADLRKPSLHKTFGVRNTGGLTHVLTSGTSFEDAAVKVPVEGAPNPLLFLASGPIPPNPSELLGSLNMHRLLHTLTDHADVVLLDLPPLLAVSDAAAVAPLLDGLLVVARYHRTRRGEEAKSAEAIVRVGGKVLGGVLNVISPKGAGRSDYYYTYYYAEYTEPSADDKAPSGNGAEAGAVTPATRDRGK